MKKKKILFLSVASALLLVIVAFGIQACDLNGDGFDGGSSNGSSGSNDSPEQQLSALFQKWQGEGTMTFTSPGTTENFSIEFIDGDGIRLTQTNNGNSGLGTGIRAFANTNNPSLDIKNTTDIDTYFATINVGEFEDFLGKELFSFQLSDTELTLNIVTYGNFGVYVTSQHLITLRSDGSYKFLVFVNTSASAPVPPSENQTAFNVSTDASATGWNNIAEYTRQ